MIRRLRLAAVLCWACSWCAIAAAPGFIVLPAGGAWSAQRTLRPDAEPVTRSAQRTLRTDAGPVGSAVRTNDLSVAGVVGALSKAAAPPDGSTVTLVVVGDIMLDETPGAAIERGLDPFAPFAAIMDGADIRVGNLECVVATSGEAESGKPYTFRAHPRTLEPLKHHFDAVTLANNHS